jgi:hypothetical protein
LTSRLVSPKQAKDGSSTKAAQLKIVPAREIRYSDKEPEKECMILKSASNDFFNGLVFGFDVDTGSIGYAVRKGADFKDVGVLICDSEGSDLSKRRDLHRQQKQL